MPPSAASRYSCTPSLSLPLRPSQPCAVHCCRLATLPSTVAAFSRFFFNPALPPTAAAHGSPPPLRHRRRRHHPPGLCSADLGPWLSPLFQVRRSCTYELASPPLTLVGLAEGSCPPARGCSRWSLGTPRPNPGASVPSRGLVEEITGPGQRHDSRALRVLSVGVLAGVAGAAHESELALSVMPVSWGGSRWSLGTPRPNPGASVPSRG